MIRIVIRKIGEGQMRADKSSFRGFDQRSLAAGEDQIIAEIGHAVGIFPCEIDAEDIGELEIP